MDKDNDIIPLDKLISRLKTDLKLSKQYAGRYGEPSTNEVKHKNKQKASLLYWLEKLKQMNSEHLA